MPLCHECPDRLISVLRKAITQDNIAGEIENDLIIRFSFGEGSGEK